MTGNQEYNTAFTLIILTFALTLHQGQGQKRTCNLFSRPHPNGLCGQKLALAHENLCFLIRQNYPQFFPLTKRSHPRDASDVDDVVVPKMKDFDDSDSGLGSGQEFMSDIPFSFSRHNKKMSALLPPSSHANSIPEDVTVSALIHLLAKRSPPTKRSLVCECCYGPCSTRTLARYC